jgi:hypothetical protein
MRPSLPAFIAVAWRKPVPTFKARSRRGQQAQIELDKMSLSGLLVACKFILEAAGRSMQTKDHLLGICCLGCSCVQPMMPGGGHEI